MKRNITAQDQLSQHLQYSYSFVCFIGIGGRFRAGFDPSPLFIICFVRPSKRSLTLWPDLALVSQKGSWYLLAEWSDMYPRPDPPRRTPRVWNRGLSCCRRWCSWPSGWSTWVIREVLAHLIVPVGYVVEAFSVSDVVNDDDAVGVAVVAVGDCAEPLLSSRVPLP